MDFVAVSALSHEGLLRDHNEDSLAIGPWTLGATVTATPQTLLFPLGDPLVVAVADGLGGHPAGDLASTIVVRQLARLNAVLDDEDAVRRAVEACNGAVEDEAQGDPAREAMGTTVAGVVVTEQTAIVFNVGDSRVYAWRESELVQLSVDDNPPLAPGQTHTSVLTQTLGGGRSMRALDAHVSTHPLSGTGQLLLCSDGLTDVVDDSTISRLLREHHGGEATYELWKAAMEAGGPDNITVALVEVSGTNP
jgi:PPM family protein phosphatase